MKFYSRIRGSLKKFESPHDKMIFFKTTYVSEYWPIAQTVDWAADSVHHIQQSEAAGRRCCKTPTRRAGGKYAETKLGSFMIPRFMFWWGNHTRVCSVPSAGCWYLAGVTTLHPPPPPEQQVSSFTWFHHNHLPPARPAPARTHHSPHAFGFLSLSFLSPNPGRAKIPTLAWWPPQMNLFSLWAWKWFNGKYQGEIKC